MNQGRRLFNALSRIRSRFKSSLFKRLGTDDGFDSLRFSRICFYHAVPYMSSGPAHMFHFEVSFLVDLLHPTTTTSIERNSSGACESSSTVEQSKSKRLLPE